MRTMNNFEVLAAILIAIGVFILVGYIATLTYATIYNETDDYLGLMNNTLVTSSNETLPSYIISKVVRVIDGDTVLLASGDVIRLAIVNTVEKGEEGYNDAVDFTKSLCLGKNVFVDVDDLQKPSYGRIVGAVYCSLDENSEPIPNNHFLNEELLVSGHAKIFPEYCSEKKSEFAITLCPLLANSENANP